MAGLNEPEHIRHLRDAVKLSPTNSPLRQALTDTHPGWSTWITPIRVVYIVFVLLTWMAYPIFNLMLFLHPFGRHALDREQRWQAILVGLSLSIGLGWLTLSILSNSGDDYLLSALVFGLLAMPVAVIFLCAQGWPRWVMLLMTLVLTAAGLTAVGIISFVHPLKSSPMGQLGEAAFSTFLIGTLASQWIANWLATQRPER